MTTEDVTRFIRPRVLVSAYRSTPHGGSENTKAWTWILAAARSNDVVVLTQKRCWVAIEAEMEAMSERPSVSVVVVEASAFWQWVRRLPMAHYAYYIRWQVLAKRTARRISSETTIDIVHHLSFGADWLPSGMTSMDGIPFVWGPVGGASRTPRVVWRYLGFRGTVAAVARDFISSFMRLVFGRRAAKRAALTLAFNRDTARALAPTARRLVVRNSVAVEPRQTFPRAREDGNLIFAGRLLPWKGISLAIQSLVYLDDKFVLSIFGKGPDEQRLRKIAIKQGVEDRVRFRGHIDRNELQREFAKAHALVFPSVHDSGGWAVAEAIEAGCPVVCLNLGGPPEIVGSNGRIVDVESLNLPEALAHAVGQVPERVETGRWTNASLPDELDRWYEEVRHAHVMGASKGGARY